MTINQVIMSVPGFFIGILITYLFGLILKWFQPGAYVPISENFSGFIGYLVAPSAAIALPRCSMAVKCCAALCSRSSMPTMCAPPIPAETVHTVLCITMC